MPFLASAKRPAAHKFTSQLEASVDRSKLDEAEAALRALDETRLLEEATFQKEADALGRKRLVAQDIHIRRREKVLNKVDIARRAYHKAGGRL